MKKHQALNVEQKNEPERFHIRDIVRWNPKSSFPAALPEMKAKFGEGPFKVVGVRLHRKEEYHRGHPEAVTIELANEDRHEMSGSWFTKKSERSA